MNTMAINSREFSIIRDRLYRETGIFLHDSKKYLVSNRLMSRLRHLDLVSLTDYLSYLDVNRDELQVMIDKLTTNETYFFRENNHFEFLETALRGELAGTRPVRIWSAACSTGEEAYSAAMICHGFAPHGDWTVLGSDINETVLKKAREGIYSMGQAEKIPEKFLKKYCLKGVNGNLGKFVVGNVLRKNVRFSRINLNGTIPDIGTFDVILFRNTLIYFNLQTKKKVLGNILARLKRGGYLIVSHTESLLGMGSELELVKKRSSIYRKL